MHTKPSDYDIKVKHISPPYIPSTVIEYANTHYKDEWYPGADKRIINYITTWNEYEAYVVYWESKLSHRRSNPRPLLYNGKKARMPDINEWLEATRILKEKIGDHVFIMGRADQGPFSIACLLRGTTQFMMDLIMEDKKLIDDNSLAMVYFKDVVRPLP